MKRLFFSAGLAFCSLAALAQTDGNRCGLVGFANYSDMGLYGTTGGGQGEVVRVSTREDLAKYASGSTPRTIVIENDILGKGNIGEGAAGVKDYISIGSNKTIVGAGNGVTLTKVGLDVNGQQNIILRNLRIKDCNPDALSFRNTHHVWVDHCDLSSCADGLLDFTVGSSYLSVSWTKFSNHDKVSICNSGTQHFEDNGRERATYHHCWFDNTTQRNPRFGYGLGHVFNNYYTKNSSYCVGYHTRAKVVVENSLFSNTHAPLNQMYSSVPTDASYADVLSRGNKFESVSGNTKDTGVGFDISRYYSYDVLLDDAAGMASLSTTAGLAADVEHDLIPFPGNGANNVVKQQRLSVGAIDGATGYTYYISKYGEAAAEAKEYTDATELSPATTYAWHAVAAASGDRQYTSGDFRFTTAPRQASCPTPMDGEQNAQLREALKDKKPLTPLRLQWRAAFDAQSYKVYLSEGTTVGDGDLIGETADTYIQPSALKYGVQYTWRVDALTADGVVTGDTWTFASAKKEIGMGKTELESAVRSGYAYLEQGSSNRPYSGDYAVVGEAGPGCMSMIWTGGETLTDITTTYFDWQTNNKYKGSFALYVNDEKKDSWLSLSDGKSMIDHVSEAVCLKDGDELRLEFYTDDKMRLRSDYITVAQSSADGIVDVEAVAQQKTLRIYTLDGRYVGDSADNLPAGIYVAGGKKFLKD